MLKELDARIIDGRDAGVVFEGSLAQQLAREVFACVEELEEAADGINVFIGELDVARLRDPLVYFIIVTLSHGGGKKAHTLPSSANLLQISSKYGLPTRNS